MVPTIQKMQERGYPVRKVDITQHPDVSRRFHVDKIPTFILLVNGQEKKRLVGLQSGDELRRLMIEARDELHAQKSEEKTAPTRPDPQTVTPSQPQQPGGLRGLFARIRQGLGGSPQNTGFQHPTFRAQSPEPLPAAAAGERAMAASVRVRVTGSDNKEDLGTGSVIHSTAEMSTILTCAHLFHDFGRSATVEVEVFRDGSTFGYPARVLEADEKSDLAILQIQNNTPLPVVEVAPSDVPVTAADSAFSVGCNHGQPPTHLPIKIVDIDRYTGPSNIVCTVDPAVGRSGGGLFNSNGQLIGVCSCADRDRHEGLYMGRQPIVDLFHRAKLSHLLTRTADTRQPPDFASHSESNAEDELIAELFGEEADELVSGSDTGFEQALAEAESLQEQPDDQSKTFAAVVDRDQTRSMNSSPVEITVIVDSPDGSQPKDVIVIKRPSPWLLELLTGEAPNGGQQIASVQKTDLSSVSPQIHRPNTSHSMRHGNSPNHRSIGNPTAGVRTAQARTTETSL